MDRTKIEIGNNSNKIVGVMFGDVLRLSSVDRYTSIPVVKKENVAEHSFWVAFYAMVVNKVIVESFHVNDVSGVLLSYALMHDVSECVTGDIVRTFKYSSTQLKKSIKAAEDDIEKNFGGVINELFKPHRNLPEQEKEYVERVVKLADFMSLHAYMTRERNLGNAMITQFMLKMYEDLYIQYEQECDIECTKSYSNAFAQIKNVYKRMCDDRDFELKFTTK